MYALQSMSLREYVESQALEMTEYTRRNWCYIKITGDLSKTPYWMSDTSGDSKNKSKRWLAKVQTSYPHAKLVRYNSNLLVFNIGSVFDLISAPDKPEAPGIALNLLRASLPKLIAQQIVGVQPMLASPGSFSLNSAHKTADDSTE